MLDPDTRALLEGGCALIVGTVSPDGAPYAARGWGLDVLDGEPCRVRLLLDAEDRRLADDLAPGRPVAVTGADVPTLRSVQLKGASRGVEPPAAGDSDRLRRYVDAFYADVEETDHTPRAVLERLTPDRLLVAVVDVSEVFDQTPGPGAGCVVEPSP